MKKHHDEAFMADLERIEQIIENLEPGTAIAPGEIMTGANVKDRTKGLYEATVLLMRKYGLDG